MADINSQPPPPPFTTPLLTGESVESAQAPELPKTGMPRGLLTMPWIMWVTGLVNFIRTSADSLVTIAGRIIAGASQTTSDFKGDHLSIRMFGATGNTRTATFSVTASSAIVTSTDAVFTEDDIGRRIVIYGAASSGRKTFVVGGVAGVESTNAYVAILTIDAQACTNLGFAGNCVTKGVTWEIFGSNVANFAVEVSVHGPEALTPLADSLFYTEAPPTYRYYRVKIKSTVAGQAGVGYITASGLGYVLGKTILSVQSGTQCTMSGVAGVTRATCSGLIGTDDTDAIQAAYDYAASRTVPGTADGGYSMYVPEGSYLFSSPINQYNCVTVEGQSGGASIFYADPEAMPVSVPLWNMTGTFSSDATIAFFSRLSDVRIDCGHIPGSIGVYCDALQENSGLYRTTIINWTQYGVQANTASDRYGCVNWMIQDPWIYPSITAFGDDTVAGLISDYALDVFGIRGTIMGQGGYICGYGKAVDVSHGVLRWFRLHVESARIAVDFNTGSGGILDGLDTQSFVSIACQIEGGDPVVIRSLQSLGATAVNDTLSPWVITDSFVPSYVYTPFDKPARIGGPSQWVTDFTYPNIITMNPVNFGTAKQGGILSVNSRYDTFPNWAKTSQNVSNKAMFVRFAAAMFEVMIGAAANANGTDPGTSYFRVDDDLAGIFAPRHYFDTEIGIGPLLWGNNLDVNWFRWWHGSANQRNMRLQSSTDSGGTWTDMIVVDAVGGTVTITGLAASGFAPSNATYITQTSNGTLTNEQALSALATGILKSTTTTGVVSIATFADLPTPGAWTSYTPGTTNLSSTTVVGKYEQVGKTVRVQVKVIGTSNGSGPQIQLPTTPVSNDQKVGATVTSAGVETFAPMHISGSAIVYDGTFVNLTVYTFFVFGEYETT